MPRSGFEAAGWMQRICRSCMQSFLFGVKALDPLAIGTSAAVLAATAALAAAIPAWAVQVAQMEVLRDE